MARAGGQRDARVGQHLALELALGQQEHVARGRAEQVRTAFRAPRVQRRIELGPVGEDRPRVDRARIAGGLDREAQMTVLGARRSAHTSPSTVPSATTRPARSGRRPSAADVPTNRWRTRDGRARVRVAGVGEHAHLAGRLGGGRGGAGGGPQGGWRGGAGALGGRIRGGLRLGELVAGGDAAEPGIGEHVAVDVPQDHVSAELARVSELDDATVLHRHRPRVRFARQSTSSCSRSRRGSRRGVAARSRRWSATARLEDPGVAAAPAEAAPERRWRLRRRGGRAATRRRQRGGGGAATGCDGAPQPMRLPVTGGRPSTRPVSVAITWSG